MCLCTRVYSGILAMNGAPVDSSILTTRGIKEWFVYFPRVGRITVKPANIYSWAGGKWPWAQQVVKCCTKTTSQSQFWQHQRAEQSTYTLFMLTAYWEPELFPRQVGSIWNLTLNREYCPTCRQIVSKHEDFIKY